MWTINGSVAGRLLTENMRRQAPATLLFLEADDRTLARRFSETRRPHPLGLGDSVIQNIRTERKRLAPIRAVADHVINTSKFNVHELRDVVEGKFGGGREKGGREKSGRGDKRSEGGPSHRQFATSAPPRDRDRPIDPNSPFAKLAALKEQLTARKDQR